MIVKWENGQKVIVPDEVEAMRAGMVCSPAQMRVALHRAGLLATIVTIIRLDVEAEIIWEYATQIERNSRLIDAMKDGNGIKDFTDDEIDALFEVAMQVVI